ncbi:MAG TPA: exodeoxyribonuclease VII large subunit [Lachnospiraceae bacterium]|nr:exodeoxyribonuclease VII large subunit [Lachnospiraceae bacterium]
MKNIYSVGQINSYIKNMFAQDFMLKSVYIKGEASNVKYHSSGHIYFTMKDKSGTITCVMFAGNRSGLKFQLQEGQQIITSGSVEVYERDGKYQLYAREITLDGAGLLYERFEQLKRELSDMGMFAQEYKQSIPKYAQTIGVVTAPTGAAIQDIINISKRRNPYVQLILYPAKVQGDGAAESIVNGIHALEQKGVDVIIVGRGGGSIEDLWAFNEEIVARAIFDSTVPIISAVGHETDTTIADYVADLRAPTPSAAAEIAVFSLDEYTEKCFDSYSRLNHLFKTKLTIYKAQLEQLKLKLSFLSPLSRIRERRMYAAELENKLSETMERILVKKRHMLELYLEKMNGLSPLEKLKQGLTFVTNAEGMPVVDVDKVEIDQTLTLQMKNGQVLAKVVDKERIRRE